MLVLPTSASTLYRRLDWLINDDRPFELKGEHYVVAGIEERLSLSVQRPVYVPEPSPAFRLPRLRPTRTAAPTLDIAQKGARRAELGAALDRGQPSAHSPGATAISAEHAKQWEFSPSSLPGGRAIPSARASIPGARASAWARTGSATSIIEERDGKRRWVIYREPRRAVADPAGLACLAASHRRCAADARRTITPRPWEKAHRPNLTGTYEAYRPPGSTLRPGAAKPPLDYEPWQPK